MSQSDILGYMNCNNRAVKKWTAPDGKIRSWGKCNRDGKSCREWDMAGFDCFQIRQEDVVYG